MNLPLFDASEVRAIVPDGASNEWFTPRWVLDWLPRILLDPCWAPTCNVAAESALDYRQRGDSLLCSWADLCPSGDGIVFVNPPYSDCSRWVERCAEESAHLPHPLVALVPAYGGDAYWHRAVWGNAQFVGFVRGRIRFDIAAGVPAKDCASFCSALVIWAPSRQAARATMQTISARAGRKVFWVDARAMEL